MQIKPSRIRSPAKRESTANPTWTARRARRQWSSPLSYQALIRPTTGRRQGTPKAIWTVPSIPSQPGQPGRPGQPVPPTRPRRMRVIARVCPTLQLFAAAVMLTIALSRTTRTRTTTRVQFETWLFAFIPSYLWCFGKDANMDLRLIHRYCCLHRSSCCLLCQTTPQAEGATGRHGLRVRGFAQRGVGGGNTQQSRTSWRYRRAPESP